MTPLALLYAALVLVTLYRVFRPQTLRSLYLSEQIPGPLALPFLGNALQFFNKSLADSFAMCNAWIGVHGDVYRMWMDNKLTVNFSHPAEAEAIFSGSKYVNKSEVYEFFHDWLNEGLLTSRDAKWHARRKILTPAFHFKALEQYVGIFDRQSRTMVQSLRRFADSGEPFDMHKVCTLYTLDVICEATMGIRLDAQTNDEHVYAQAVEELTYLTNKRMFSPVLRIQLLYLLSPTRRKINRCLHTIHSFTESLIEERRAFRLANRQPDADDEEPAEAAEGVKRRQYSFIDILLSARIAGQPLTNRDIREEVDTFVFEGHDTTAAAINFALYHIAKHADVQHKCVAEIAAVLGPDRSGPLTMGQLSELAYLDLVIKETLRLYPSVPAVGRAIERETTINGRTYPADTQAIVNLYAIHHNPKVYDQPDQFRPERFAEPLTYAGPGRAFAYVPFSAGSRNCIGQKFAELELKSVLAKVLRDYVVRLHPDSVPAPRMNMGLVFKTERPLMFYVEERVG